MSVKLVFVRLYISKTTVMYHEIFLHVTCGRVMLLTFILIIISIPSPLTLSFQA